MARRRFGLNLSNDTMNRIRVAAFATRAMLGVIASGRRELNTPASAKRTGIQRCLSDKVM